MALASAIRNTASTNRGWDPAIAQEIIRAHAQMPGAGLPMLHALQDQFGFVPPECEGLIADALNLSRAEVHGLISFYHDFRREPAGRHVLKLCRAEACQAVGAVALASRLLDRLGIEWGQTTADWQLTVEPVFCLGLCACGPAALLDDEPLAGLNDDMLAEVLPA